MGRLWELDLHHAPLLVLLAMADHANADGEMIFPSEGLVAWKTGYSVRQVRRILRTLTERGYLIEDRWPPGRSKQYRIDMTGKPLKAPRLKTTPDKMSAPLPGQSVSASPDKACPPDKMSAPTPDKMSWGTPDKMSATPDIAVSAPPGHSCVRLTVIEPSLTKHRIQRAARTDPPGVVKRGNPECHDLVTTFVECYKIQFGIEYAAAGRDYAAAKRLLKIAKSDEIMEVATEAWARRSFWCKQARTLCGLGSRWNEIKAEIAGSDDTRNNKKHVAGPGKWVSGQIDMNGTNG